MYRVCKRSLSLLSSLKSEANVVTCVNKNEQKHDAEFEKKKNLEVST